MITVTHYIIVSALLFTTGVIGVIIKRNAIVIFMSVELMLNAVNLALVAFSKFLNIIDVQVFVFLVMVVAAVEVAVGLALIIAIFRLRETINVDEMKLMKW